MRNLPRGGFAPPPHPAGDEKTIFERTEDGVNYYLFVCEGCGAMGELGIEAKGGGRFTCPQGCGATYIQWVDARDGLPALMCVVKPVWI